MLNFGAKILKPKVIYILCCALLPDHIMSITIRAVNIGIHPSSLFPLKNFFLFDGPIKITYEPYSIKMQTEEHLKKNLQALLIDSFSKKV